jgi:hypothetical protein
MSLPAHLIAASVAALALAASAAHASPDLTGVYAPAPGRVGVGGPDQVQGSTRPFTEDAPESAVDPARLCQPVGPFRMMARSDLKFELVPTRGAIVMLFEDISHGYRRTIHLDRGHRDGAEPSWQGDSVGRWEGSTLVVDTIGFNDYTWLNGKGVRHSPALRLVERIRPLADGGLEYRVTATDPKALRAPAHYVRYFRKAATPIAEDGCDIEAP